MNGLWAAARKFAASSWLVFVSQGLEIRHMWFWSLVMMSFIPLTMLGFLLLFGDTSPERVIYIVTGSITYSVALQAGLSLGQGIGYMKVGRVFDYDASLPITKPAFIFGLNLKALVLCVPSTLTLLAIALLSFGVRLVNPGWLLVAFVLGGFSLAGLGAAIGFYSRSGQIASIATQIATPIVVFFAPVYMPEAALPTFLRYTAWVLPTTHVARLVRSAFGDAVQGTGQSVAILAGFVVLSVLLVQRGLDWRGDRPLA